MNYQALLKELKLDYCAFSISRVKIESQPEQKKFGCTNQIFPYVSKNGEVYLSKDNIGCKGGLIGLALNDGLPNIPGGFGNFIAQGGGPGCPPGERIKCNSEIAEKMLLAQPQGLMQDYNAIKVAPYNEDETSELVCTLANPDQLSALLHLFYFRKSSYDDVIVPVASGCAQIFRIAFGELKKENPKAVMGNIDFFSRPHLEKDILSLTVTRGTFEQMCEDVPESFLYAPAWNGVKKRL